MTIGNVLAPGPDTKLDITRSSSESVKLNSQLQYGVQWFLQKLPYFQGSFSGVAAGATGTAPTYPGLNLAYLGTNVQVALNALQGVTDVEVLATPRMLVLANDTARLQVGSSVPIITTASSGIQANSLVVNNVEYRDTGVVLVVTPRVGAKGEIYIDIEQEVSDVSTTTTSDIDSPTIDQRKFHTQIAVESGESVAIGGLIQTSRSRDDSGVPGLSRIPVVGAAFRQRNDQRSRDELVVFLKPTLVRSRSEADAVTDELAAGLRAVGYGHR